MTAVRSGQPSRVTAWAPPCAGPLGAGVPAAGKSATRCRAACGARIPTSPHALADTARVRWITIPPRCSSQRAAGGSRRLPEVDHADGAAEGSEAVLPLAGSFSSPQRGFRAPESKLAQPLREARAPRQGPRRSRGGLRARVRHSSAARVVHGRPRTGVRRRDAPPHEPRPGRQTGALVSPKTCQRCSSAVTTPASKVTSTVPLIVPSLTSRFCTAEGFTTGGSIVHKATRRPRGGRGRSRPRWRRGAR